MSELNLSKNMDEDITMGLNNPYSIKRMDDLYDVNESSMPELETSREKIGVSDAVKNLEKETRELFPEKDEVSKTTIVKDANNNKSSLTTKNEEVYKIMGLRPLPFSIVLVGVAVAGYFLYKKVNK